MMALKKKAVDARRFAKKFVELFGRPPTAEEFREWCTAWGGRVRRNKCIFVEI